MHISIHVHVTSLGTGQGEGDLHRQFSTPCNIRSIKHYNYYKHCCTTTELVTARNCARVTKSKIVVLFTSAVAIMWCITDSPGR